MIVIFGLLSLVLYAIFDYFRLRGEKDSTGKVLSKVPPAYPIVGHLIQMLPTHIIDLLIPYHRKYGPNWDCFFLGRRTRYICDLAVCKELLSKRPKVFRRFVIGKPTKGLFSLEGAMWARIRRLTSPHFSNKNVMSMVGTVSDEASQMIEKISEKVGQSVRMEKVASMYTARIIGRVALGVEKEEMSAYFGTDKLFDYVQLYMHSNIFKRNYVMSVKYRFECMFAPYIPASLVPTLAPSVHVVKKYQQAEVQFVEEGQKIIKRITAEVEKKVVNVENSHVSLLELLIQERVKENAVTPISDVEVFDNMRVLFVAGSETTSATIAWCVYLLCVHPVWQTRLREEVNGLVIASTTTHEEIARLVLVKAFVKECLRMYCPSPFVNLELTSEYSEYTLVNGMKVRPDDVLYVTSDPLMRDRSVFTDADSFVPERWLTANKSENEMIQISQMEAQFLGFGGGSRVCPGMDLAYIEAICAVSAIVSKFSVELACSPAEVKRILIFTAKPNQVPVIFTPL